jgi:hypothetical protein
MDGIAIRLAKGSAQVVFSLNFAGKPFHIAEKQNIDLLAK